MATSEGIGHDVRFPLPNGLRHGRGRRVWANGASYDGRWRKKRQDGKCFVVSWPISGPNMIICSDFKLRSAQTKLGPRLWPISFGTMVVLLFVPLLATSAAVMAVAAVPGGRTTAWRVRGSTSVPRARATRDNSGPTTATAAEGVSGEIGTTPRSGTAHVMVRTCCRYNICNFVVASQAIV